MTRAPDYAEPIVGWRVWLVAVRDGRVRLRSVAHDLLWPARRAMVARCRLRESGVLSMTARSDCHRAPSQRCACGLYAARDPLVAASQLPHGRATGATVVGAIGRVAMWGEVVACQDGWRAARAYPRRLYVFPAAGPGRGVELERLAQELAVYGVPVDAVAAPSPHGVVAAITGPEAASRG